MQKAVILWLHVVTAGYVSSKMISVSVCFIIHSYKCLFLIKGRQIEALKTDLKVIQALAPHCASVILTGVLGWQKTNNVTENMPQSRFALDVRSLKVRKKC